MVGPVPASQKLPSSIHQVKPAEVNLDPLVESRRAFTRDVLAQAGRIPSLGTLRSVAVAADEETLVPRDARQVAGVADGAPLLLFEARDLRGKLRVKAGVVTRLAGDGAGTGWARWYDGNELEAAQTPQGLRMAGSAVLRFENKRGSAGSSQIVVARDVSTGKVRWSKTVKGEQMFRPDRLAVADGNLLIARSHDLVSVDLTSGALRPLLTDNGLDAELDVKADDRAIVAQAAGLILTFERRPR
jgi:hypothetical protein